MYIVVIYVYIVPNLAQKLKIFNQRLKPLSVARHIERFIYTDHFFSVNMTDLVLTPCCKKKKRLRNGQRYFKCCGIMHDVEANLIARGVSVIPKHLVQHAKREDTRGENGRTEEEFEIN